MFRFPALFIAIFFCLSLAACNDGGGGDVPDFPTVISLGEGDIFPSIINSSLAVGENRVVMQLIDVDDDPILDAAVHVRYFDLNSDRPAFSSEADARLITAELAFVDENAGFERTVTGDGGVYVTHAAFGEPGSWGAEIEVLRNEKKSVITYRFNVLDNSIEPGIGDPAPPSEQATTATEPLAEIDSSYPLRPAMHTTTVADALTSGKPLVIAFATPAFCTSRTCGPVLDVAIDPLVSRYGNDVVFIHIEPYRLADAREANLRNPVPAALEWRLQSEPWVFVVDAEGNIAAKFEGIVSADEIESVLQRLFAVDPAASSTATTTPDSARGHRISRSSEGWLALPPNAPFATIGWLRKRSFWRQAGAGSGRHQVGT